MNESSEQAIQLAVNITIFIIALSIGVTLMFGVRNMAENAIKLDKAVPEGSKIIESVESTKNTYNGYELINFYANYISNEKIGKSGLYNKETDTYGNEIYSMEISKISGVDMDGKNTYTKYTINNSLPAGTSIETYLSSNGVNMKKKYQMLVYNYDKDTKLMKVVFKEIG